MTVNGKGRLRVTRVSSSLKKKPGLTIIFPRGVFRQSDRPYCDPNRTFALQAGGHERAPDRGCSDGNIDGSSEQDWLGLTNHPNSTSERDSSRGRWCFFRNRGHQRQYRREIQHDHRVKAVGFFGRVPWYVDLPESTPKKKAFGSVNDPRNLYLQQCDTYIYCRSTFGAPAQSTWSTD